MADPQDLQRIIDKFSELKISDDTSGGLQKRGRDHSNMCREMSHNFYALALPEGHAHARELEGHLNSAPLCQKFFFLEAALNCPLVFEDLKMALLQLKSKKGGRLKGFPTEEEALAFASTPLQSVNLSDKDRTQQVTPQILVKLRKIIEKGESETFSDMVWKNPKLLIGGTDNPSVLQEGTHVNALHISAKYDQPILCQLILDILQNQRFLEELYPCEKPQMIQRRKNQLLDLYLNTPDKTLGDTPLHYASKFGSLGCVIILIAHEFTIPDPRNIDGKTPAEIICSRSKKADTLSVKIQEAFKHIYYVTILRSENVFSPPVVGRPSLKRNVFDGIRSDVAAKDLNKTELKIKAFAGPMTMEKAELFYQLLKNPSSLSLGNGMYKIEDCIVLQKIRRSDPEKGLERIARLLADDLRVDYMEHFPMLNVFTNLSKEEGLLTLENYINGLPNSCVEPCIVPTAAEESLVAAYLDPKAHVNSLGHDMNVHLREQYKNSISSEEQFYTPPGSPDSDSEYIWAPEYSTVNNPNLFIKGGFTRHDVDALLAVRDSHVCVDEKTFPSVYEWKNRVEKKLRESQDDLEKMKHLTPLASVAIPRLVNIDKTRKKLF